MTRPACGSDSGYQAHRRRGEDPCQSCKDAHNVSNHKALGTRKAYDRAYHRALRELARRHRGEFAALLAEERGLSEVNE